MTTHPAGHGGSELLQNVREVAGERLAEIQSLFKPGTKATLLIRRPAHPDGSQDFLLTDDAIDDAIAALQLLKTREPK